MLVPRRRNQVQHPVPHLVAPVETQSATLVEHRRGRFEHEALVRHQPVGEEGTARPEREGSGRGGEGEDNGTGQRRLGDHGFGEFTVELPGASRSATGQPACRGTSIWTSVGAAKRSHATTRRSPGRNEAFGARPGLSRASARGPSFRDR